MVIDKASILIVNIKYLTSIGTTILVGGIISIKTKQNRVNASKILTHNVTFSLLFVVNMNTNKVDNDILEHGTSRLTI